MQLQGRRGLILNGASGVGQEISRLLQGLGAELALTDPDPETARAAARALSVEGHGCDHSGGASALGRLAYELADSFGDLDLVIAVLREPAPARRAEEVDAAEFENRFAAAQRSLFSITRQFAPAMRARGAGAMVFVHLRPAGPDPWAAATAGWIAAAAAALARDWAAEGLRINAVLSLYEEPPALPRFMAARAPRPRAATPLGRLPRAADIAAAAVGLCLPTADAVTGQALRLDGGRDL